MGNLNIGNINLIISEKFKRRYFGNLNESHDSSNVSINKFLKLIKESPILKTEFKVLRNIENKHIPDEASAIRYIDNNIKLFEIYTLNEVFEEKKKLLELYDREFDVGEYKDKINLYRLIDDLIIQSLSDHEKIDVDLLHETFNQVLEHVRTPKNERKYKDTDLIDLENVDETIIKMGIDKFNERYATLTENDKKFLFVLIESDDEKKKELFEDYKNKNIKILNETSDAHLVDRKHKALEKIKSMIYNKDTIDDDLIKLHELKKGLI